MKYKLAKFRFKNIFWIHICNNHNIHYHDTYDNYIGQLNDALGSNYKCTVNNNGGIDYGNNDDADANGNVMIMITMAVVLVLMIHIITTRMWYCLWLYC